MTHYQSPSELYSALAANNAGQTIYLLAIAALLAGAALLMRRWPARDWLIRVAGVGAFYVSLAGAAPAVPLLVIVGNYLRGIYGSWLIPTQYLSPLTIIMGVALVLRVANGTESLWYDETFTARMAALPDAQFATALMADVHPPLAYLPFRAAYQLFGDSPLALRAPALLFSLASIWMIYKLGRLYLDRRAALWAAGLMAVMPAQIYYGSEARAYSLLMFAALLVIYARTVRARGLWVAAVAVLPLIHNIGYIYAGLAWLEGWRGWRLPRRWLIAAALVPALWLPGMLAQSGDVADGFWLSFSPGSVLAAVIDLTVGHEIIEPWILHAVGGTSAALLIGAVNSGWLLRKRTRLMLAYLIGVPAILALLSIVWQPVYLSRALLPVGALLCLVMARAATTAGGSGLSARLLLIPALMLATTSSLSTDTGRVDLSPLSDACNDLPVFATSIPAAMIASYYVGDAVLWDQASDLNQSLPPEARAAMFRQAAAPRAGRWCLPVVSNALTGDHERALLDQLRPFVESESLISSNRLYSLRVLRIEVR